ncbi:MAG: HAMP domain-containing sensor histidine kinase [Myxococcota bacterium]
MQEEASKLGRAEIEACLERDMERVLPYGTAAFGMIFTFEALFHVADGERLLMALGGLNAIVLSSAAWRLWVRKAPFGSPDRWALLFWALISLQMLAHIPSEPVLSTVFLSLGVVTSAITFMPARLAAITVPGGFVFAAYSATQSAEAIGTSVLFAPFNALIVGVSCYFLRRNTVLAAERQRVLESELATATAERARLQREHEKALLERQVLERERALRENEHLVSMGILTAGIAHQVNNPVGAILGSAELAILESEASREDSPTGQALRDIRDQAKRAGRVVRSVLDRARNAPAETWPGDLSEVLRIVVRALAGWAAERAAIIELDLDPEIAKHAVRMNALELEEAFVNLVRNGIEASGPNAHVRIEARVVGDDVEVRVEDDGPGVSEEDRPRVFEAFYSSKRDSGGTGLGLHLARSIVEAHEGTLTLAPSGAPSRKMDGACFVARLPLVSP